MKVFALVVVFAISGCAAANKCKTGTGLCCADGNPNVDTLCELGIAGNCCTDTSLCCPNHGSLVGGGFKCCAKGKTCVPGSNSKNDAQCIDPVTPNPNPTVTPNPNPTVTPNPNPTVTSNTFKKDEGCDPEKYTATGRKPPTCCHPEGCALKSEDKYCCASDTATCCNQKLTFFDTETKEDVKVLKETIIDGKISVTMDPAKTDPPHPDGKGSNNMSISLWSGVFFSGSATCCDNSDFCCPKDVTNSRQECCKKGQRCVQKGESNSSTLSRACEGQVAPAPEKQTDFYEYDFWGVLMYLSMIMGNFGNLFGNFFG